MTLYDILILGTTLAAYAGAALFYLWAQFWYDPVLWSGRLNDIPRQETK